MRSIQQYGVFFNYYLAAPRPTWGHCQEKSLTNPMLITVFDSWFDLISGNFKKLANKLKDLQINLQYLRTLYIDIAEKTPNKPPVFEDIYWYFTLN